MTGTLIRKIQRQLELDQQPAQHRATAGGHRADARPYPDRGAPLM